MTSTRNQVSQYEAIAQFYDFIMLHVNYAMWAQYILRLLNYFSKDTRRIIDLSCGTGELLQNFHLKKITYFGNDLSHEMLKQARSKPAIRGIPLIRSDFRSMPFRAESFDTVLVLYDSINYLISDEDVRNFFNEAARVLRSGGLLIFDAVSPYTCKVVFRDYHESHWDSDEHGYDRRSWYDAKTEIQYNAFNIKNNGREFSEIHAQRIRPVIEWQNFLDETEFRILGIYHNFTLKSWQEKSERVHFICKKVQPEDGS